MILTEETEILGAKPVPMQLCPQQVSVGSAWDRARDAAVNSCGKYSLYRTENSFPVRKTNRLILFVPQCELLGWNGFSILIACPGLRLLFREMLRYQLSYMSQRCTGVCFLVLWIEPVP